MVNWIISSSILILVIILLRYLFKGKISLRLQYALWLLAAIRLLIPVNFGTSSFSVENLIMKAKGQPQVQSMMEVGEQTLPITSYEHAYEEVIQRYEEEGRFAEGIGAEELEEMEYEAYALMEEISVGELVRNVAFGIWIAGAVIIGTVFLVSNIVFGIRVKRSRKQVSFATVKFPVYVSASVETPCLFGVFKPSIYITKTVVENETLLRHSVLHEMTHFSHGDSCWSVLRCICLALHWYNPLVWKAAALSKRDAELACDEATLRRLGEGERVAYGETLLQLTCEKRPDLFVAATTMTSGKKSIKERIILIARKPKVKKYAIVFVMLAALMVVGCTFTNGKNSVGNKMNEVNETTETSEEIASTEEVELEELLLYDESEKDQLCLAIMPDGISKAGGDYRYIIPKDQIVWMDAYKEMKSYAVETSNIQEMGRSQGIWIVFNDEWTEVTEEGFVIGFQRTVEKDEAKHFWNLCVEEAMKYGSGTPVRPEELTSLVSATLNYGGSYTVTDEKVLAKLERSLGASEELRGGGACPFTAELVLGLENGDTQTIYLATDSCTVWLSDGVYYTYSGFADIEELKAVMQEAADVVSISSYNHDHSLYETFGVGDYYTLAASYEANLNHDEDKLGDVTEELLEVYTGNTGDGDSGFVLFKSGDSNDPYSIEAHTARAGWTSIYLIDTDVKDYLFELQLEIREGFGNLSYEVYYFGEQLGTTVPLVIEDSAVYSYEADTFDEESFISWAEGMESYLKTAQLLLSTQDGELRLGPANDLARYNAATILTQIQESLEEFTAN